MDTDSQNTMLVLNTLASAVDRLQSFGYALYLETKARSWIQPRSITVSGKGFQISHNHLTQRFDRALILGCSIQRDATKERSIIFSLLLAWNPTHWFIQSSVEDEDMNRDTITHFLWESPEYQATTITGAIQAIDQALTNLMASVTDERVAASMATIEPRHS
jgi:hypothetical protein